MIPSEPDSDLVDAFREGYRRGLDANAAVLEIVAAARGFAQAYVEVHDRATTARIVTLDQTTHDLLIACGEQCPYCEPETCPDMPAEIAVLLRPVEDLPPL